MKILIVNDSRFETLVLETMLKELGLQTNSCDEYNAIEKARSEAPDLILVNLYMKEINGDVLIEKLKKVLPKGIYVLTSSNEKELRTKMKSKNVTTILKTPASKKDLKEMVKKVSTDYLSQ
ncbi:response regulator [Tindallia californiensis]|uniref:Stage 0 sporulation protein A homolog n=1 Tax=Tindallia californiensis TaxID=159292 RepID=A0A1H3IBF9_9FIRM|nr:response regulator [Tindallia californiensis]SDY24765.1 two-component system, CitB family, response regulator/two-component system, chemotaxis family, response regulator CheY [Tindallia californiensis]